MKVVPQKSQTPIMECVLIDAKDGILNISVTNNEMSLSINVSGTGEGTVAVNAAKLTELVKLLPEGDVTISAENNTATIDWGFGSSNIPAYDIKEWPELTSIDAEPTIVSNADLIYGISHALPHTADDEMRPIMMGIFFNPSTDGWDCAASDSRTLSVTKIKGELKTGFVLPKKAAAIILNQIPQDGQTTIYCDGKAVEFMSNDTILRTKVTVGKFPNYQGIMPTGNVNVYKSDITPFISCIRRVSTCANKATPILKFTFGSSMKVEAEDSGFGVSAREGISGDYTGDEIQIGFKSSLILRCIDALRSDNFTLAMSQPTKAALITADGDSSTTLIMPVQI